LLSGEGSPILTPLFLEEQTVQSCWQCHRPIAPVEGLFCPQCNGLQRLPHDPFRCLGLDVHLNLDLDQLRQVYYSLSRQCHPDFYPQKSAEEQQISLENSASLTVAYRTLKDPILRAECLVRLVEGRNGEADGATTPTPPAELFDDILDLEETLMSLTTLPGESMAWSHLRAAQLKFSERGEAIDREMATLFSEWDTLAEQSRWSDPETGGPAPTAAQRGCVARLKQTLSHRAYLERAQQRIATALAPQ
jgi:DnaJ-domain-containing protein 1